MPEPAGLGEPICAQPPVDGSPAYQVLIPFVKSDAVAGSGPVRRGGRTATSDAAIVGERPPQRSDFFGVRRRRLPRSGRTPTRAYRSEVATPLLRIGHSFDIALLVRGRRKQLRLRQAEVARAAGVGREWLVDLEHGKPTAEVGKILRLLEALGNRKLAICYLLVPASQALAKL